MRRVRHDAFGTGVVTVETDETYRVTWDHHRTRTGRDWSNVDKAKLQFLS